MIITTYSITATSQAVPMCEQKGKGRELGKIHHVRNITCRQNLIYMWALITCGQMNLRMRY